jgi:hypothetical protein
VSAHAAPANSVDANRPAKTEFFITLFPSPFVCSLTQPLLLEIVLPPEAFAPDI